MIPRGRLPKLRRTKFLAPYPSREFLIVRWLQLLMLALLAVASGVLSWTSFSMVRTHFIEKYGVQAYLLPGAALLAALFLLFRFILLWRTFREERKSGGGNED